MTQTESKGIMFRKNLKDQAHEYFDKIWLYKYLTRPEAYKWLSEQLGIPEPEAHMRAMNDEQCKQVIEASIMVLNDMRRLDLDFGATPKHPYYYLVEKKSIK